MNTQEAKFILQAYRPGGEDAADPQFAEALQLAKLDPELAKWFAEQLAFDAAASRALKEVKVPPHLRESILAGERVIEPALWWQRPVAWAMAAALVVLLGLAGFWLNGRESARFAGYQKEMILAAEIKNEHLNVQTNDVKKIQVWFAAQGIETNYALPAGLRGQPGMGCRVLDWKGNKVAMICYVLQGNHLDLFIAEKSDFKGPIPEDNKPQFAVNGSDTTASWSQAGKVYLLVGHGPADEKLLRKYLQPQSTAQEHDRQNLPPAAGRPENLAENFFGAFPWNKCDVAASD